MFMLSLQKNEGEEKEAPQEEWEQVPKKEEEEKWEDEEETKPLEVFGVMWKAVR